MIVIKVELWSARTGTKLELARMHISNQETTTIQNPLRGDYLGQTFRGRGDQLNKLTKMKEAVVENWPREAYHVWNLVSKMLIKMGYTQGV